MKHEFRLADIGEGLEEAEIIAWRVQIGDTVQRDEPLVEVMTDKSNADLPAPWSGTIVSVGGSVGDIIKVGEVIAIIDDAPAQSSSAGGAAAGAFESAVQPSEPPATFFADTASAPTASASAPDGSMAPEPARVLSQPQAQPLSAAMPQRAKASPTTRRQAARRGIDITQVVGSGPGGRVLLSDLDAFAPSSVDAAPVPAPLVSSPPVAPASTTPPVAPIAPAPLVATEPLSSVPVASAASTAGAAAAAMQAAATEPGVHPLRGIRRLIARNMTQSWTQVPHIHAWREIDAEPLMALRSRLRDSGRDHYAALTPLAFFVNAVAHGMRTYPIVNSSLDLAAETITTHASVNIGIAVASPQGLVVPVIRGADQLSLSETAGQISDLVGRARAASLGAEAFREGTATITNFGSLGGETAAPIIRPPESVIVGFGSIAQRPFVVDGAVAARHTMNVVVAADHRLLDGDVTTAFLNHVCEQLVDPIDLALGL